MDEERSVPAISPEPPDDGDPDLPAPQPGSHASSATERANSCPSPDPCPSSGKEEVAVEKQTNLHKQLSRLWRVADSVSVRMCWRKKERLCKHLRHGSEHALNRLMFITTTTKFN